MDVQKRPVLGHFPAKARCGRPENWQAPRPAQRISRLDKSTSQWRMRVRLRHSAPKAQKSSVRVRTVPQARNLWKLGKRKILEETGFSIEPGTPHRRARFASWIVVRAQAFPILTLTASFSVKLGKPHTCRSLRSGMGPGGRSRARLKDEQGGPK